ncbi:Ig-like domain-containing protein [Aeromonas sp. MR16]|nr:Ig-like domain-containing protein [Aeromonas sp. MR16]
MSNAATQFLAAGETVTFSYDVTVTDNDGGSATETVTITLQGTNDAAVITGTGTAAVAEDTALVAGQLVASGDLDATDVDSAATFTVQTNVASAYGLFSIDASGAWSYKADNTHAAIQQLSNGGTLTDTIVVSTADGTTHNVVITINGTADASVIIAPDNLQYDPDSGDQTPFNRLMFVDADTTGSVTVTITRTSGDSSFSVTGAPSGGTAVGGNNATITGTIANINAWLAGNNLTHDSNGNDPDTFTIAINSGGSISSYVVSEATFTSTGNADTNNYAGVNVLAPTLNAGSGGDTVYTSWSHVGAAATNYTDDFVTGTDTIYLNFTATQLQEILTNATTRDDLQTFLFNADGNDLNLDATSWNATVSPSGYFEVANIGLANVWSTRDTVTPSNNYLDINTTWKGVIAANSGGTGEILGLTGTASAEMIIASGAGTVSGLAGNDVLVAQNSGNTLDGGANNDLLLGGTGADVLIGGAGGDMLAGGGGADTFKWGAEAAGVANADIIADYNFTEGDKLDLSSLLTGFQAGADVAKFVKLSVSGENLLVSVDTTGSGNFASGQTYTLIGANAQGAMPVKVVFGGYDHILSVDSSAPAAPSVPDLQVASDSGLSSTDNITSDNTPTVSGTSAEAGATVTLYDTNGTTVLGTTIAALDGSWTITSSTLTSGAHTLTAKVTDWAGNISPASAGLVVTIDTSVAAPVVSAVTADNGSSGTDEITNDTTLVINGTAEANSSVQVFRDGVSIGTTTANGSGNWSFDHTGTTLAQGNYNFTAQATDVAGNLSVVSAALPVTVDTSAPTVSAIVNQTPATAITNADSLTFRVTFGEAVANVSTGDFTVNGTTATVTGVSAINANTYDVTISGGNLASLNGTVTLGFAGGQNITDIAGNALTATTPTGANNNSYTLDNTAAAPTALNLAAADDSGSSNSDNLTQNTSALTIDGAGENGATVTVFRDIDNDGAIDAGESLGTATVVGGVFSLDVSLAAGNHNIRAIQTDVAGNTSAASASGALNITVDTSVAAPVVNNVTADNGSSGTDEITNDTTLIINGTAEANSSVQVFRDGVSIGTTTANGSGNWSFDHTGTTLAQGNYNFTAQATDVAGNVSAVSAALPVTIDTTAPTQTALISTVTDNVSPVTGTLTSGGSTNDTSLALAGTYTGTLGAGEVVAVYDGATRLGTATASAGSWTYADSTLANGDSVSYTVRVEDVAGNQGTASAAFTTTIDMTAPTQTAVISTVTDNVSPVTGTLTSGGSTNDTSLALAGTYTGTLGAGEVIAVYDGATRLGTATASAGSWTYTDSTLANGDNVSYTVRIEDAAGNQGTASAAFTTTIDTLSPTATLNITAISTDSGISSSDFITNDTSLTVSGSNMALGSGEKIQISSDGGTNWTDVTQNTSTSWSLIDGISHGSNFTYQARVVDAAGNVGNTDSQAVTIDTNAPTGTATISTVTDNVLPVTGTLANGASTNDTTLALTGTSTQGSGQAIGIFDGGVLIGTTTTTSGGAWSFTTSALVEGAHSLTAALIDTAGNGNLSAAFGVTVDTTAPASPSITLVTDNVGTIQGDVADNGFTNDTSLVVRVSLSGTGALAGNTVQLSNNTTALGGAVTLSGANITNGYVDITTPALTNGTSYNLRAAVTDTAGNAGALSASGARDITVDTAAPAVTGGLGNLYSNTDNLFTLSGVTDATGVASVSVHDNGNDVADFSLSLSSGSATNGTWTASGNRDAMNGNSVTITLTDMAGNVSTITGTAPAGTAGEPIHLALAAPAGHADVVMLTIAGVPQGWTLSEGTDNGDGTWTVVTDDPSSLTVTTAADFAGAMVLPVHMSWTNADGSTGSSTVLDNVEAYAPGSPIFALSQDDNLSGSAGADTFVFAQPIAHNQVYGFDVAADRLDLIGFGAGLDFASLQIADDGQGNAVVTLGPDSSITLRGVDSTALSAANVVFDLAPELSNAGEMVIHDGAMLPLGGFLDNSGRVVLDSHGQTTRLEVLVEHLTLRGGGQVVLSDNPNNLIVGSSSQARLVNENNSISGAGHIGAGQMALLNASLILANGLHALELDTGNNVIGNSGTLESTGAGGMTVASAVENSGHLWANGGDLRLLGDVTGSGSATIDGDGTLSFAGAAHIGSLAFHGDGAGTLVVGADEAASLGTILGLEQDDELLLGDLILGADTRLSYSANAHGTGGLLTVTDGVQSAELHLLGHYSEGDFLLTDDAEGGVRVGYGGASSGTLIGTLQDDDLQGGAGNDILAGRAGSDALHGGGGADSFVWLQGDTHAGEVTRDYVADFNQGEGDRLDLSDLLDHDGSKSVDDLKSLLSMVQDTDGIHLQVKDTTTHQVTQDIVLANHTFGSMTGDSNSTASQVLDYMLTNHRLDIDNP